LKHLKTYKRFENSDGSSTSGMGNVISAQPGSLPGTFGTTGSGDVSFYFKKKRRKKGNPSQVSDLRDLSTIKTNKITESIDEELIKDCVVELFDEGFELINVENSETRLKISLLRGTTVNNNNLWIPRYNDIWSIRGYSRKNDFIIDENDYNVYKKISKKEKIYLELAEESIHKLINFFDFAYGAVHYVCMFDENLKDNYKMSISLWKSILNPEKNISESYTEEEYQNSFLDELKKYDISPTYLNQILNRYSSEIDSEREIGTDPKIFANKIADELQLSDDNNFLSIKGKPPMNQTIKYL
jgi:hypothetical protein